MIQRRLKRYSLFIETKIESSDFRTDGVAVNFSYNGGRPLLSDPPRDQERGPAHLLLQR